MSSWSRSRLETSWGLAEYLFIGWVVFGSCIASGGPGDIGAANMAVHPPVRP